MGWTELATLGAMQIEITEPSAFVACLALGTLRAIRVGALTPDAGIWSLGQPWVYAREYLAGHVHDELLDVLSACDELPLIGDMLGRDYRDEVIDGFIERVTAVIAQEPERFFGMRWVDGEVSDDPPAHS